MKKEENQSYQKSIMVNATTSQAYYAITSEYSQWWTTCEGAFNQTGDQIAFKFPPQVSFWQFEAKELIPEQSVKLKCIEAHHILLDKPNASKTEWLGSFLRFKIERVGDQVRITFLHEGLVPKLDCYDVCEAGWDHFFLNSLKKYLNTGAGEPHQV